MKAAKCLKNKLMNSQSRNRDSDKDRQEAMMIKCVIWDLDETIWKGTLENGDRVTLRSAADQLLKTMDAAGIMQSIVSRNHHAEAMHQLKLFGIDKYFLYPQINYLSKLDNIRKIIEELNIYADTVVFIDDSEFETSQINYFLPQIKTVNSIEELEQMVEHGLINRSGSTFESANRRELMNNRRRRQEELLSFQGTREEFLISCNMNLNIRKAQERDEIRVLELAVRANQLNSFKRNLESSLVKSFLTAENKELYVCELKDRFGEHGIVGTCFVEVQEDAAVIKQFCISCRIEGRGIGFSFLAAVIRKIQKQYAEVSRIICNYCVNKKNSAALYLLKTLRFQFSCQEEDYRVYGLKLPQSYEAVSWLKVKEQGEE